MSENRLKIGIAQGDPNGIGWEVILKTLPIRVWPSSIRWSSTVRPKRLPIINIRSMIRNPLCSIRSNRLPMHGAVASIWWLADERLP